MNYNIITYRKFDKELKRLAKRYKSLKKDYADFLNDLERNPIAGVTLSNGCHKIRMKISSKQKGKSGGARVITCIVDIDENTREVGLHYIYDKSERESISDKELKEIIKSNFSL